MTHRPPRPWLSLGVLLAVSAIAWVQCLWGPSFNRDDRWLEHVAAFVAWTPCLAWWLADGTRLRPVLDWALVGGLLAAGLGEALQFTMQHHIPQWQGFGWSAFGVAIGLLSWRLGSKRLRRSSMQRDANAG